MIENNIIVRNLGIKHYSDVFDAMHNFTVRRTDKTSDEIWFTEHPPVFTQGKAGKAHHILKKTDDIPVIQTDRGGQITYHGFGQQIMYILIDLKRKTISIRDVVNSLENCIIDYLLTLNIIAKKKNNAPGVYIAGKKISSLGLHIIRGCTLHGLAFNLDMDLKPFTLINPCGYANLKMTMLSHFIQHIDRQQIRHHIASYFATTLSYDQINFIEME